MRIPRRSLLAIRRLEDAIRAFIEAEVAREWAKKMSKMAGFSLTRSAGGVR